jgi:hypothetical protein
VYTGRVTDSASSRAGYFADGLVPGYNSVELCNGVQAIDASGSAFISNLPYLVRLATSTECINVNDGAPGNTFKACNGTYATITDGISQFGGNLVPNASGTIDIGTATLRFGEIQADDVYADDVYTAAGSLHVGNINISETNDRLTIDQGLHVTGFDTFTDGTDTITTFGSYGLDVDTSSGGGDSAKFTDGTSTVRLADPSYAIFGSQGNNQIRIGSPSECINANDGFPGNSFKACNGSYAGYFDNGSTRSATLVDGTYSVHAQGGPMRISDSSAAMLDLNRTGGYALSRVRTGTSRGAHALQLETNSTASFAVLSTAAGTDTLVVANDQVFIGNGEAGVDYKLTFDGETNDGTLTWQEDESTLHFDKNHRVVGAGIYEGKLSCYEGTGQTSFAIAPGGTEYLAVNSFGGDGVHFGVLSSSARHHVIFTSIGNVNQNHGHSASSTNPIVYVHSVTNPSSDATQWLGFEHDQTDGVIMSGKGDILLLPASNNVTIGNGAAGVDYTLTFDGETNDGVITWLEDEDMFDFSCDLRLNDDASGAALKIAFDDSDAMVFEGVRTSGAADVAMKFKTFGGSSAKIRMEGDLVPESPGNYNCGESGAEWLSGHYLNGAQTAIFTDAAFAGQFGDGVHTVNIGDGLDAVHVSGAGADVRIISGTDAAAFFVSDGNQQVEIIQAGRSFAISDSGAGQNIEFTNGSQVAYFTNGSDIVKIIESYGLESDTSGSGADAVHGYNGGYTGVLANATFGSYPAGGYFDEGITQTYIASGSEALLSEDGTFTAKLCDQNQSCAGRFTDGTYVIECAAAGAGVGLYASDGSGDEVDLFGGPASAGVSSVIGAGSASKAGYFSDGTRTVAIADGSNAIDITSGGLAVDGGVRIDDDGFFRPKSSDDGSAPINSIYYSTTQSKLVYKDSGGTVNVLY